MKTGPIPSTSQPTLPFIVSQGFLKIPASGARHNLERIYRSPYRSAPQNSQPASLLFPYSTGCGARPQAPPPTCAARLSRDAAQRTPPAPASARAGGAQHDELPAAGKRRRSRALDSGCDQTAGDNYDWHRHVTRHTSHVTRHQLLMCKLPYLVGGSG